MSSTVPELRRRADAGDGGAQLSLGVALLTGEGTPPEPIEGAAFVEKACEGGSAEAASLLATMEAMGAGRPQSWDRAFDYLLLAAERGLDSACAQLQLLNRDPDLMVEAGGGSRAGA